MNGQKRVLCTGAAGFIGSHLVRALRQRNHKVTCLVHPADDIRQLTAAGFDIIRADLGDKDSLLKACSDYACVYHLGAVLCSLSPEIFYRVNFQGTKNLVEVFLESGHKPDRFLFTSSIAAVGPCLKDCVLGEESPCHPVSHYGRSKLLAEKFLRSVADDLPVTIVRLPLVYGPHGLNWLYSFFWTINKGFCLSAGHVETSLGYIDDVVRGIILAAESQVTVGRTYFLGEDKVHSSDEIFRMIEDMLGKKALKMIVPYPIVYGLGLALESYAKITKTRPIATREILRECMKYRHWQATMRKAKSDFGYEARVELARGLRATAAWYRQKGLI